MRCGLIPPPPKKSEHFAGVFSGGVYPVFPCQHPADYDFVQPDGFGDQYDFNGIVYMWDDGDRLIAVIIFSASIMVPVLKIIAMAVLIYSAYFKPVMSADKMSVLYRITESIGRWSMIDIL